MANIKSGTAASPLYKSPVMCGGLGHLPGTVPNSPDDFVIAFPRRAAAKRRLILRDEGPRVGATQSKDAMRLAGRGPAWRGDHIMM